MHSATRRYILKSAWASEELSLFYSGCRVLSDGVSSPLADESFEPLMPFQDPVVYVLGLPGFAIPFINAAWVPT